MKKPVVVARTGNLTDGTWQLKLIERKFGAAFASPKQQLVNHDSCGLSRRGEDGVYFS